MNTFETVLLAAVLSAEQTAPIFVHSATGILYVNASENFLNNLLAGLAAKSATSATASTAPKAS